MVTLVTINGYSYSWIVFDQTKEEPVLIPENSKKTTDHLCYHIEGKEAVSLRVMRDITGFGGHRRDDFGQLEELRMGLNEEQFLRSTRFEISARWLEELVVRIIGFREAFFKEDDERVACFPQGARYLFLSFGYRSGDENGAVGGIFKTLVLAGVYLGLGEFARALKNGTEGTLGEEHIAEGGT